MPIRDSIINFIENEFNYDYFQHVDDVFTLKRRAYLIVMTMRGLLVIISY